MPPGWIVVVSSVASPNGSISSFSFAPVRVATALPPAVAITLRTVTARDGKTDSLESTSS